MPSASVTNPGAKGAVAPAGLAGWRGPSGRQVLTVLHRLATSLLVLIAASFAVFMFIQLAPGGPEQALVGRLNATPELLHAVQVRYGLDEPLLAQYWLFLKHAAVLDFGQSIQTQQSVLPQVLERFAVTGPLVLMSFLITLTVGIALGALAAYRRGTGAERFVVTLSIFGASMPAFAIGVVLLYVVSLELGLLPSFGAGEGFVDRLEHLLLPAITMAIGATAAMLKLSREAVANVLREDHITFAYARGLSAATVLRTHVLRNAAGQLVTASGVLLISLLTTTTVVETVFGLRGVGAYLVQAVESEDIPVVQCIAVLTTMLIIAINLLTDAAHHLLDPRPQAANR